jgi:ATP-dependent DNA helicase RecG
MTKSMTNFKESETLELKRSTSELKEAVISIAAILNKHQGGKLYFGIRNNGEVIGQAIGEETLRDVTKAIAAHIEPRIYPKVTHESIEGKTCIMVDFQGTDPPYFAYGRPYMRTGDEDRQLSVKELGSLILKKVSWEEGISERTVKDVSTKTLRNFVRRANEARRINFRFTTAASVLNKLNLLKDGKLLRATEVLFCDNNSLEVQAAVFAGTDKLTFLDISQLKGNIFDLLEQSESYVKEHINWRADLTESGRREIPEIPLRAATEALVNSLCHRDYANPKGNEIAIFKDRVEIYNPGQFPEEFDPEDFIKGEERSILRNPLIANTLYFRADIERWGSGLRRIYTACREANVKVEFRKLKSGFLVVFSRSGELIGEPSPKSSLKSSQKILEFISHDPNITIREMASNLGISDRAVKKNIQKLKDQGLLRRVGPARGGHWEIVEQ